MLAAEIHLQSTWNDDLNILTSKVINNQIYTYIGVFIKVMYKGHIGWGTVHFNVTEDMELISVGIMEN